MDGVSQITNVTGGLAQVITAFVCMVYPIEGLGGREDPAPLIIS
jgi:hypothetical protein